MKEIISLLVTLNIRRGIFIDVAVVNSKDRHNLLFNRQRHILALLEDFNQSSTTIQLTLGRGIKVGTELGKGRHLTIMRREPDAEYRQPASSP